MELKKEATLVAVVKPKAGDIQDPDFLGGRYFSRMTVEKVDQDTALACEEDGRFIVRWLIEKPAPAPVVDPEPEAEPEPAPIVEDVPEVPDPDPIPEEDETTEEPEPTPEEPDLGEILTEFDVLLVRETDDYLDKITDPKILTYLAENAEKKGSRENAVLRLSEVEE